MLCAYYGIHYLFYWSFALDWHTLSLLSDGSDTSLNDLTNKNNNNNKGKKGDVGGIRDSSGAKTHEISEHNFDTVSCTSDYERQSLDFDRHSSEDELVTINKENVAEKRKWSQVHCSGCCDSSSDEEVKEFLLNPQPVLLSSTPPKGVQRVKVYTRFPSQRQVLARMAPVTVTSVSPRKRHRHATSENVYETESGALTQRPCLDFEKMQQVQAFVWPRICVQVYYQLSTECDNFTGPHILKNFNGFLKGNLKKNAYAQMEFGQIAFRGTMLLLFDDFIGQVEFYQRNYQHHLAFGPLTHYVCFSTHFVLNTFTTGQCLC